MKMGRYFQIVKFVSTVLVGIGIFQPLPASPSCASTAAPPLTAEEIVANLVRRNFERAQALKAYRGSRVYRLEYRGFAGARSAEMSVDVQYRSPGTKEFIIRSEKGSHLLIDRVFQKLLQSEKEALTEDNQARVALNTANYRFTLAGYETLTTRRCYVLSVEPRTKSKFLYRGRIWVDSEDFAVVRIDAAPAQNPSFWTKDTRIEQTYAKVGGFWLPSFNRSSSAIRLGGHADFTIDYHDYQITAATTQETGGNVGAYR
jgi:MucB/RseB N-terminal domain